MKYVFESDFDKDKNIVKIGGKIIGEPNFDEAAPPAEIASIFEFYSR